MRVSRACAVRIAVRRFLNADDAGPMVEFALVAPMLMFIILVIADFSLASLARNKLVSAVREGARIGAVHTGNACGQTPDVNAIAAIKATVKAYLELPNTDGITVDCTAEGFIQVDIEYPFKPVTSVFEVLNLLDADGESVTLSARAVYRWERSS